MNKDQKKQFAQLENVRFKQEQAVNRRVDRSLILSCYGLIDPKELPTEVNLPSLEGDWVVRSEEPL